MWIRYRWRRVWKCQDQPRQGNPSMKLRQFYLFSTSSLLRIYVSPNIPIRVPRHRTTRLVMMMPMVRRLISIFLTNFILTSLNIIRIRNTSLSRRRNFSVNIVTFTNGPINFSNGLRLTFLIIRLFNRSRRILIRIRNLLTRLTFDRLAITFNRASLSTPFSPIRRKSSSSSFRRLVIFRILMKKARTIINTHVSRLNRRNSFPRVSPNFNRFMINFRLTPTSITNRKIINRNFFRRILVIRRSSKGKIERSKVRFLLSFRNRRQTRNRRNVLRKAFIINRNQFNVRRIRLRLRRIIFTSLSRTTFSLNRFMRLTNVFRILTKSICPFTYRRRVRRVISNIRHSIFHNARRNHFNFLVTCQLSTTIPLRIISTRSKLIRNRHRQSKRRLTKFISTRLTRMIR